jgi:transcriptional regulator with XRE-family HTH domain
VTTPTEGDRIAQTRKLRHLTQQGLARASGVSVSHLAQIEQGRRPASPTVLAALARALSVPVADLTGQPYLQELRRDHLDGLIQPLREALDIYDLGADPDVAPRPVAALEAHADRLCRLVRASDLRTVSAELPAAIVETTTAAHTGGERRVWQALASLYRSAYDVASKLGFYDLASIALDRTGWAAERASDAHLAAVRQYNRALTYLRAGDYRTGMRIADIARRTVAQADPGPSRDAVTGQVHLASAVLAARAQDRDTVADHIAEADRIAATTGEIPQELWLSFGPTNVQVHHVSVLIDQTRYAEALDLARGIRAPAEWPASRAAHHHAEVARAQLWMGTTDSAFRRLLLARHLAPQQTRLSPVVRETIVGVVRAGRAGNEDVASYAKWVGVV